MRSSTIHLLWCIALLLLVVAALLISVPDGNIIQKYLSFTAAISSILLAIVAIFYSMISNRSFENTLAEIRSSASNIAIETAKLSDASSGLSEEAEEIIRKLALMPDSIASMPDKISTRIGELTFGDVQGQRNEYGAESSDVTRFVAGKPIGMALALYLVSMSYRHTKDFDLKDVVKNEVWRAYVNGVLEGVKHFNNCGIKIDGVGGSYIVRDIGTLSYEQILEYLDSNPHPADGFMEKLHDIKIHFVSQSEQAEVSNFSDKKREAGG